MILKVEFVLNAEETQRETIASYAAEDFMETQKETFPAFRVIVLDWLTPLVSWMWMAIKLVLLVHWDETVETVKCVLMVTLLW